MTERYRGVLLGTLLTLLLALPATAFAQQKTTKECNAEWTANKAQIQANGTKKSDFIKACRVGQTSGTSTGAAAGATSGSTAPAASAPAASAPAASASKSASKTTTAPTGSTTNASAGQFAAEGQAKAHCPSDTVVWANTSSKIYHFNGNKDYGNTKQGAYMCEKDAQAAGIRAAKNETHP